MEVTVSLEVRYAITPDGSVWSQGGMARSFWERYLEVFAAVKVVARARLVDRAPEGSLPVTGKDIYFHRLPDFCGPWQYLKRYAELSSAIREASPKRGAVIMRVSSQIANTFVRQLTARSYPYGLEVLGDPYDVFAPGVIDHPLRSFFRWHSSRHLRQQCHRAAGVSYVTRRTLQERYPPGAMGVGVSDVDLPEEAVLSAERRAARYPKAKHSGPFQLVTVGSLAQLYKGTDLLIEAVGSCVRAGLDVTAVVVGDGKYRACLTAQAESAGLTSRVRFAGQVAAGREVRGLLDAADVFVLPSRTEGLPRAVIEAMARGLPCIATTVGGIPELLQESDLVPPGDAGALAAKLQEVLRDPGRMDAMSRRNLETAMEYRDCVLAGRRRQFYEYIRDVTQEWEQQRQA